MPQRARKQPPILKFLSILFYVCFCALFVVLGAGARWISSGSVTREFALNYFKTPQEIFGQDSLNVLILGCDEDRAPGGKKIEKSGVRSDMMLLARLDFAN